MVIIHLPACLIDQVLILDEKQSVGDEQRHRDRLLHELHPGIRILVHLERVVDRAQKPERRPGDEQAVGVIYHLRNFNRVKRPS